MAPKSVLSPFGLFIGTISIKGPVQAEGVQLQAGESFRMHVLDTCILAAIHDRAPLRPYKVLRVFWAALAYAKASAGAFFNEYGRPIGFRTAAP
jgi:hypothetical protein